MRLLVHMGLHQTGSTAFQQALNSNHVGLAIQRLWYDPRDDQPAHHDVAGRLLLGDPTPLEEMIARARHWGCDTVVLSSEDLEGALWDPRPLAAVAHAAHHQGVESVEWHAVLGDPGAAFARLVAQSQHHLYADPLHMLVEVMTQGGLHGLAPVPGDGAPYRYHSFDTARDLTALAQRVAPLGWRVVTHDDADARPFPGWRLLGGALAAITRQPDARNRPPDTRPPDTGTAAGTEAETMARGPIERVLRMIPGETDRQAIRHLVSDSLRASLAGVEAYASIVGRTFGPSRERALATFPWRTARPHTRAMMRLVHGDKVA